MEAPSRPSLLERLSALLMREPEDRAQLMALLRSAHQRSLLDADALSIIEGALAVSDMQVRDVMVPRAQMQVISLADAPAAMASQAIETGHSRFPVTGENRDDVIGILLAKDLLRLQAGEQVAVRDLLRPAEFIPDSKRLNVLLREFRASRNHMAIVVDEYGGVAGLVTIEDVLEQIVGDIEDEYDFDEAADSILLDQAGHYRVKATTGIETFDAAFGTRFAGEDYNTVGGMVIHHLGRLPRRGEIVQVGGLRIQVLRADSRRVHTLLVDLPRATT